MFQVNVVLIQASLKYTLVSLAMTRMKGLIVRCDLNFKGGDAIAE